MSHVHNEDWDLCWYYLSGTGCRNSNCSWRHENPAGRLHQSYRQKKHGIGSYYRGELRKKPRAPFYPVNHDEHGGFEDQYGLVHYPKIENYRRANKRLNLLCKLLYRFESEYCRHRPSPMSVSSQGKTSPATSSGRSLITSQGGSDSECDMLKKVEVVSRSEKSNVQKQNSCVFQPGVLGELRTSRRELKMTSFPDKASTSVLSPLAAVFVPGVKSLTSTNASRVVAKSTKHENSPMTTMHQPPNLKSSIITINDELPE